MMVSLILVLPVLANGSYSQSAPFLGLDEIIAVVAQSGRDRAATALTVTIQSRVNA
jgi:hypothetical protein